MEKVDKSLIKHQIYKNAQIEDKSLSEQEQHVLAYAQRVEEAKGTMVIKPEVNEEEIQEILENIRNQDSLYGLL